MNFLTARSLFYYFLLRETVINADIDDWRNISNRFGVENSDIVQIETSLHNAWLNDLVSVEDITLYNNYLQSGFLKDIQSLLGVNDWEQELIEIKKSALLCARNFFGEEPVYNRLRLLARGYGNDSTASVLYALILERNGCQANNEFIDSILQEELNKGNGDAGLVLLNNERISAKSRIIADLSTTPEMVAHPEVLSVMAKTHGCVDVQVKFKIKQPIGFGRINK